METGASASPSLFFTLCAEILNERSNSEVLIHLYSLHLGLIDFILKQMNHPQTKTAKTKSRVVFYFTFFKRISRISKICAFGSKLRELCPRGAKEREKENVRVDFDKLKPLKKRHINNLQSERRWAKCTVPWRVWGTSRRFGS